MLKQIYSYLFIIFFGLMVSCNSAGNQEEESADSGDQEMTEEDMIDKAREIHQRVITLDTHCDINTENFTSEVNYTQDLETQVTLPKMEEGGLDVAWFIVYTGQGELTPEGYADAYKNADDKFKAIHRLCEEIAPDRIELAYNSDDVRRINESGKKVAMIGIENGYPIGEDLTKIKEFADRGGLYMSLSHNGHSQLSDSNTGERDSTWLHNGLSELGKEAIREMNKWGIMVDISHPSKEAIRQMIELSKTPVIASHSSARALCDHSRNLDDEMLEWVRDNGGVVQTVALGAYINKEKSEKYSEKRSEIIRNLATDMGYDIPTMDEIREMPQADRAQYWNIYREVTTTQGDKLDSMLADVPRPNVADFVDHIDYMVEKMGIDHVGISSDFDGGGGIDGWDDASETFNVTFELVRRGYTEEEITKIWSGNLLRVLDETQEVAKQMQSENSSE